MIGKLKRTCSVCGKTFFCPNFCENDSGTRKLCDRISKCENCHVKSGTPKEDTCDYFYKKERIKVVYT